MGSVVYVPVGTAVAERDKHAWNSFEWDDHDTMLQEFPQGPLRATAHVSLPHHKSVVQPGMPWGGPHPGHPRSEELVAVRPPGHPARGPGRAALRPRVHPCLLEPLTSVSRKAAKAGVSKVRVARVGPSCEPAAG